LPLIRNIHLDRLFIGNALDARNVPLLFENGISAVLDLAVEEPPAHLARDMIYCRFPITDGDGNTNVFITAALRSLVTLVENEIRTLVACSAGMSRSPAIAAAAVAIVTRRPIEECLVAITTGAPHDVSPIFWSRMKTVYNQIVSNGD
jgi:hypothetical protein